MYWESSSGLWLFRPTSFPGFRSQLLCEYSEWLLAPEPPVNTMDGEEQRLNIRALGSSEGYYKGSIWLL